MKMMTAFRTLQFPLIVAFAFFVSGCGSSKESAPSTPPNFLWLTIEDTSAYEFGCYGNTQVKTPNIDALAARGVRFTNASSTAPHCSPARSTLISGSYATTYGSCYHRKRYPSSDKRPLYPTYLKEAGYFCINVTKTDYNIDPVPELWEEGETYDQTDQPFFAIYNQGRSHMTSVHSQRAPGRNIPPSDIDISHLNHLPNLPEIRANYAWHLRAVQDVDTWVGEKLEELKASGMEDDTIIFFYSDHGGCQPRGKAYPYESGLRVPLIIYVPPKYQDLWPEFKAGSTNDQLVGFEDLAPTVLSLIGVQPPDSMQGQAFLGKYQKPAKKYQFGFRTNTGVHFDPVRTVREGRFKYIRNYVSHKPLGMRQSYQWGMEANQAYDLAHLRGELSPLHASHFKSKPPEALFDLDEDPNETVNLADNPDYKETLTHLRDQLSQHIRATNDLGFFPPHSRKVINQPLYDWVRSVDFPMAQLHSLVELAAEGNPQNSAKLEPFLTSEHAVFQYWAAIGYSNIAQKGHPIAIPEGLRPLLESADPDVACAAAAALCYLGEEETGLKALMKFAEADAGEAFSSIEALLKNGYLSEEIQAYLPMVRSKASTKETAGGSRALFHYRSMLVQCGINLPTDLFKNEKW